MTPDIYFPPEWAEQQFVQLTWPHNQTDWAPMLNEVNTCFVQIAKAILKFEALLIVSPETEQVKHLLSGCDFSKITFANIPTNDTWARDHGGISIFEKGVRTICDFTFNGWGMKFAANYDNQITKTLFEQGIFGSATRYKSCLNMVLEGGSIETDGQGTLLTTKACLLSENRNAASKSKIEKNLKTLLRAKKILWLKNGFLAGDDTDSHIDTLARICPNNTIAYVQCTDINDIHYHALKKMEAELKHFTNHAGEKFNLVPLPMADAVYFEGERLPATYANFLIINGAVLVPTYQSKRDELAVEQIQQLFPDRKIIPIDCSALIKQHGSLHCVTMQYV
ncbi:MAG: agmatine deiminase [Porphyromonadaceae bacterium CG2_30_38_12]|nr:MAG: agmatine deiminase [Porphyromonadaceae bacterium CG2_30_38_12]